MPARKINFPILMLGVLVVLMAIYAIATSTSRQSVLQEDLKTSPPEGSAFEVAMMPNSPPPPTDLPAPPNASPLPRRVQAEPGPDIAPTAAPGVAFNYRYAYRLAPERIAEVQEQHARACEQLSVNRCRITGMRYRVAADNSVEAMLAVKLEPGIARRFGRNGTDAVVRAEGKLIESDIAGTDADSAIRTANRSIVQMSEDLRRVEQRLSQRLSAEERSSLDYQADQLRRSIRGAEAGREDQQESLASTPMVFQYVSGEIAPATSRPSLGAASERAFGNFEDGISILLIILVTLLPWALFALVLWWIARLLSRRLRPLMPRAKAALSPA